MKKYGASLYEMATINRCWRAEQLDVLRSQLGARYLNGRLVYISGSNQESERIDIWRSQHDK